MKKLNKKDKNSTSLLYQIRIDVVEDFAIQIRTTKNFAFNSKIDLILKKYKAELVCQFNAFEGFVLECERSGNINNPLYKWTKDTILDEVKKMHLYFALGKAFDGGPLRLCVSLFPLEP